MFYIYLDRFSEAAAICPKILRQNGELWEEWILLFNKSNKLSVNLLILIFIYLYNEFFFKILNKNLKLIFLIIKNI